MTREEIEARLKELNRKLDARKGKVGYSQNVTAIAEEIDRLEQELNKADG